VPADDALMTRAIDQGLCSCLATVAIQFPPLAGGIAALLPQSSLRMVSS
jgi:hypothetical protein